MAAKQNSASYVQVKNVAVAGDIAHLRHMGIDMLLNCTSAFSLKQIVLTDANLPRHACMAT